MNAPYLTQTLRILLFFVLSFAVLYFGRPVLVPLAFGGVFALLMIPLSQKLEGWGCSRAIAAAAGVLTIILAFTGIFLLLKWQLSDLVKDMDQIQQRLGDMMDEAKHYVNSKFGITPREQQQIVKQQQSGGMEKAMGVLATMVGSMMSLLVSTVLILVYMYLFIYFRGHFKSFILKIIDGDNKPDAKQIMNDTGSVTQKYLTGLGMMIVMLWVLYGIGFTIVGVKSAIFFAILCGVLELIPFAGNLTGTTITVLMTIAQGGDSKMVIGVLVVYGIVQFTQTYILEPMVVGEQVNINPLFTILVIVIGEAVWGIAGMILAIPLFGVVKIICDHVDDLKPYAYLIGANDGRQKEPNFLQRWFSKSKG